MNLKQAHYIQTVAREGGITPAAKKLHISQPSLSQMLKQVEGELGVALFDRSVSPFQLTFAGEKYLHAAEIMLRTNEQLENEIREIKDENSGRLRLGISVQRAMQVLPLAMPWFAAQFPHVNLEITERGSAQLEELVQTGEVDLALAALESVSSQMTYELIEREVIGVLAGAKSQLALRYPSGTAITLDMAAEDTFISLKEGHRRLALGTGSCMLCSDIYVDDLVCRNGAFYPLRDYENHRHFYACYRKREHLPKYISGFIQIVSQVLSQNALMHSI